MTEPRVSIIMPAHNASKTIAEAVHSALNQSMGNLELIVCDDASNDGTGSILNTIVDKRLKAIRNETNLGAGRSRDKAIELASAPWLAVIDADDRWKPDRLEKLLAATDGQNDVLVFDDLLMCHEKNGVMTPWRPLHGNHAFGTSGDAARNIALGDYITAPRLLIKPLFPSETVKESHIRHSDRKFGEDAEFFLRLAMAGLRFRYFPEALYLYRITPGSATANIGHKAAMRECIESCAAMHDWPPEIQRAFSRKIDMLRCNETLYAIAADMCRGNLQAAIQHGLSNPRALKSLPGRLLRHLGYQFHRMTHGGASR